MEKDLFSTRKTYHLLPDKGDWKIVEEVAQFVLLSKGKNKSALLKEVIKLARKNKPGKIIIYKSNGDIQEDRLYGGHSLPQLPTLSKIVSKLKILTAGLYYPSESDYPFEIYTRSAANELIGELYKISGKPANSFTEMVTFGAFFERFIPQDWMDEEQKKNALRFLKLKQYLAVVLKDHLIVRIGEIEIAVFITGKTVNDHFVILKSTSIET